MFSMNNLIIIKKEHHRPRGKTDMFNFSLGCVKDANTFILIWLYYNSEPLGEKQ